MIIFNFTVFPPGGHT